MYFFGGGAKSQQYFAAVILIFVALGRSVVCSLEICSFQASLGKTHIRAKIQFFGKLFTFQRTEIGRHTPFNADASFRSCISLWLTIIFPFCDSCSFAFDTWDNC